MKLKVKKIHINTGNTLIAVINKEDAKQLDIYSLDRITISNKEKRIIATVDITDSEKVVRKGEIGLFEETIDALHCRIHQHVAVSLEKKPRSVGFILKKMKGERLNQEEIFEIVKDINEGKLTDIEMTYFVAAGYIRELSLQETVSLTKAMIATGTTLKLNKKIIVDKHCIGGVAGNRTTMIVVPILAAAGLTIPKTSSRSITSAAGTADTVEVLCDVTFPVKEMKRIVEKTNACFAWGGAVNLAPADDKIIKVESPMSLDPVGQLIASILAKKKSVCATHVLIDIPVGRNAKIESRKQANMLKKKFLEIGHELGLKMMVILTDGTQPIGNGIGPALEAKDVIETLRNSPNECRLLRKKSLFVAGLLLEMCGKAKKGEGRKLAEEILLSGKAYRKFFEIVKAQGGKEVSVDEIPCAKNFKDIFAQRKGIVRHVDNKVINKLARLAGAPHDKEAGVYLFAHKGCKIKKGDKLFRIYSDNKKRLEFAYQEYKKKDGIAVE